MNDAQLDELLRSVRVPERTDEQWNELAADIAQRAHLPSQPSAAPQQRPRHRVATWAVAGASLCVLVGVLAALVGSWRARREVREIADARKLFAELSVVFPQQIEAIILGEGAPQLILTEQPQPRDMPPLYVRICRANGCERIITFSGANVLVHGQHCDVLLDVRGHVIVAGERFVWTSADPQSTADGYQIRATQLSGAL